MADIQNTIVERRLSELEGRLTALERSLNWRHLFSATALPVVLAIFIAILGAGWFLTGRLDEQGQLLTGRLDEQGQLLTGRLDEQGQRLGKLEQQVYNLTERADGPSRRKSGSSPRRTR